MTEAIATPKPEEIETPVDEQKAEFGPPSFESEEDEDDSAAIRQMRARIKEQNRELEELRRFKPQGASELRARPSLWSDHDGNEDAYEADLEKWLSEKAKLESAKSQAEQQRERVQQAFVDKKRAHAEGITAIGQDDASDADTLVQETLTDWQYELLVRYSGNSPALSYALGTNPTKLAKLAAINDDVIMFDRAMRDLEGKMTMAKRPKALDRPAAGGKTPVAQGDWSERLKAAEQKADETGNRDIFLKMRREARASGHAV